MMPGIQYGLGIYSDQVMIRYVDTARGREKKRVITSVEDFAQFIKKRMKKFGIKSTDDLIIMCSSSMDFPEDSTDNKVTIALARKLR